MSGRSADAVCAVWSGTLADLLSPARLVIFGTLLTTLNKPMFAGSGYIYATYGTVATLYWVTAAKVRPPRAQLGEQPPLSDGDGRRHNSRAARAAAGPQRLPVQGRRRMTWI